MLLLMSQEFMQMEQLKDRRNYELYDFEELGRGEPEIIETGRMITVGEYGGIKGFRNVFFKD